MRTIRISEEVWQAIAGRGKFGETENDVLERIFEIQKEEPMQIQRRTDHVAKRNQFATIRMHAEVRSNFLHVSFEHGRSNTWALPDASDKSGIRRVRDAAVEFAKENGASFGQQQAVKKALTNAEFWLAK